MATVEERLTKIEQQLNGIETAIQLLSANIQYFRTELLVVKGLCNLIASHTGTDVERAEQERERESYE